MNVRHVRPVRRALAPNVRRLLALSLVLFLGLAAAGPSRAAGERPAWQPARTWAVFASTVRWKDKGLSPFLDRPRLDDALVATVVSAGVPRAQITYLRDEAATLAAIRAGLSTATASAGAGSTLVFSFQGHGMRERGKTTLCCYDIDTAKPDTTGLLIDDVAALIETGFKGERVLLFGDCCHSGALGAVAERLGKRGIKAAALTSSMASNTSTSHWTFTEALISTFAGEGTLDDDKDGALTFAEAEDYVHDEMKWAEGQLTRGVRAGGFEADLVVRAVDKKAPPPGPGPWPIGAYVEARDQTGKWYGARVIGHRPDAWKVHFPGWEPEWDEWLPAERLRALARPKLDVGKRYEVQWSDGRWYPATVTKEHEGFFYFVHYQGEVGEDDEWITGERARAPRAARAELRPFAERKLAIGDVVAAPWRDQWWLARVASVDADGLHHIDYDDGTKGTLLQGEGLPISTKEELVAGARVLAAWRKKGRLYPGVVASVDAKGVVVKWDDGDTPTEVPFGKVARIRTP